MLTGVCHLQIQDSTAEGSSMQEAAAGQSDSGMSVSGANVDTVVAVTGAVLYAQGLWGLWYDACNAKLA